MTLFSELKPGRMYRFDAKNKCGAIQASLYPRETCEFMSGRGHLKVGDLFLYLGPGKSQLGNPVLWMLTPYGPWYTLLNYGRLDLYDDMFVEVT